jgi:3-oxoacyl-[acyl-carrier protein] reductase
MEQTMSAPAGTPGAELAGQVAFVTGGATGIGLAVVRALAARGASVAFFNRNLERAEAAAEKLRGEGLACQAFQADVARSDSVDPAFAAALERFGRVDVLVNNAGLTRDGVFMRMSDEQWDAVLDTNLAGAFRCCRAVARPMMKARYGRIVNVSSVVGLMGNAGQANYAASKAGVIALSKSLARELGKFGVTVNVVAPGMVLTDMTKALPPEVIERALEETVVGRLAEPADCADAVLFLCSARAGHITGEVVRVDGGQAI